MALYTYNENKLNLYGFNWTKSESFKCTKLLSSSFTDCEVLYSRLKIAFSNNVNHHNLLYRYIIRNFN